MDSKCTNATGERIAGRVGADMSDTAMLDVNQVATLLNCSSRHVYRLSDAGRMPRPVKLGSLVRWSRAAIQQWIESGCQNCRKGVAR